MFLTKKSVQSMLAEVLGKSPYPEVEELVKEIKELVGPQDAIPKLKKEIAELKLKKHREIEELKLKRDIEERDIKHLVKIKEEKLNVEFDKKEVHLKGEFKDKELALQNDYFNKSMEQVEAARKEIKDVYSEIMKRLPNVNMDIQKDIA